ncbi:IQ motif containing G [Homo sapiens]|uniref:Dynein regulatory complex protein 9 n=4 Tax=Homo sapiens TaxID=9606 RepID=DRC9_HUMAN|nr:dynein regulatory complex protein 9 isoform a [Homo sapiens]NP_001309956.1 dynein regulatory complex protein 9 isoform a [Homo sapiens]NP_115639.1 dynein regulatory complex protein 9 isoform a [Homo sapiens]XP_024309558.1 dynein regulatory complex protein 9 isoform X1 [Homo sapiens]XP_054204061.1 dynein regulatory complex protein 9 isoform X1 [Homo sapiens]Q9H095.1 RecName: Full=Dynein regulatory complex protein 9; AltName: Full=IQ domain-containing protein G [Homo sapiens]8J07_9 Chain 9, |eukprot:NP_001127907.1 dynein regulatory complex protein 9 isoform a [Homo sapiens]
MEEDSLEDSNLPPKVWHSEMTVSVTGEPPSTVEEEGIPKETDIEIIPEIPETLEPLSLPDVLRISAVLEDTTDQLSILNYIMPVQYEGRQSICVKSREMNLEGTNLDKLPMASTITKIPSPLITEEGPNLPEIRHRGRFAVEFNKMQDLVFKKPTRQTIMTTETLKKIQIDRQFFSDVIADTIKELQDSATYNSLLQALSKERENKMHFYDIIAREEKGRKQIISLQKQLINVKKEWQFEVQSQNEYIANLKDQLQEMKAKSNLENRYMKTNTELQIAQTQKKCNRTEELLVEEIEKLRMKTEEEARTHTEIEMFLRKEQQKLEERLEFWMEKYDKDTEMKQNELNALKATKASDLAHLQDLAKMIREYEQVIIEDRIEKERSKKKVKQDLLELKSVIKLQAWWRGTMIRREIGGFKMPKDKVDSKDSKGKGKGKDKRRGKKK